MSSGKSKRINNHFCRVLSPEPVPSVPGKVECITGTIIINITKVQMIFPMTNDSTITALSRYLLASIKKILNRQKFSMLPPAGKHLLALSYFVRDKSWTIPPVFFLSYYKTKLLPYRYVYKKKTENVHPCGRSFTVCLVTYFFSKHVRGGPVLSYCYKYVCLVLRPHWYTRPCINQLFCFHLPLFFFHTSIHPGGDTSLFGGADGFSRLKKEEEEDDRKKKMECQRRWE